MFFHVLSCSFMFFQFLTVRPPNGLLIFRRKQTHSEKNIEILEDFIETKLQQQRITLEIVEDVACEAKKMRNLWTFRIFDFCFQFFFSFFVHFSFFLIFPFSLVLHFS